MDKISGYFEKIICLAVGYLKNKVLTDYANSL